MRAWVEHEWFLLFDLEATCSAPASGGIPRHEREVIEIGAVAFERSSGTIRSSFQTCVRPVRHPRLTEYCRTLTGITQREVDRAPGFVRALGWFHDWASQFDTPRVCAWGHQDEFMLRQDCRNHGVEYLFDMPPINLKREVRPLCRNIPSRPMGLGQTISALGIEWRGQRHRALDDAWNTAAILAAILRNRRPHSSVPSPVHG